MSQEIDEVLDALEKQAAQNRVIISALTSLFATHPKPTDLLQRFQKESVVAEAQLQAIGISRDALADAEQLRMLLVSLLPGRRSLPS